ncbi:MAG: hypothetical protein NT013_24480, partial [Planctomycetia bacterium]|nr:hypothetical protein [Planctomycetia bacterium]
MATMLSAVAGVAVQTLADVGVTEATRDVIAVHDRLGACLELCVRRNLLKCLCSVEDFWHSSFEEDGEVVESLFPLRDGHRP